MAKRGRKSRAEELGLTKLLDECWTDTDRKATIKKLAELAKRGNIKAIEILMAYTYGKPVEPQEHSGALTITVNYADVAAPAHGTSDDQAAG